MSSSFHPLSCLIKIYPWRIQWRLSIIQYWVGHFSKQLWRVVSWQCDGHPSCWACSWSVLEKFSIWTCIKWLVPSPMRNISEAKPHSTQKSSSASLKIPVYCRQVVVLYWRRSTWVYLEFLKRLKLWESGSRPDLVAFESLVTCAPMVQEYCFD